MVGSFLIKNFPHSQRRSEESLLDFLKQTQGDPSARWELIFENLGLVINQVLRFRDHPQFEDVKEDLLQEGCLGLHRALSDWDPSLGALSTYSIPWIRKFLLSYLAKNEQAVSAYSGLISDALSLRVFLKESGTSVEDYTFEELHRSLNSARNERGYVSMEAACLKRALKIYQPTISLNAPVNPDWKISQDKLSLIPDPSIESPFGTLVENESLDLLKFLVDRLPWIKKTILSKFFGLGGEECHSLSEIAPFFGCTPERIRQLKEEALLDLKQLFIDFEKTGSCDTSLLKTKCAGIHNRKTKRKFSYSVKGLSKVWTGVLFLKETSSEETALASLKRRHPHMRNVLYLKDCGLISSENYSCMSSDNRKRLLTE